MWGEWVTVCISGGSTAAAVRKRLVQWHILSSGRLHSCDLQCANSIRCGSWERAYSRLCRVERCACVPAACRMVAQ